MKPITKAQRRAVKRVYDRDPDGSRSYREFRRRVIPTFYGDDVIMLHWCGMWLGIETDGYTHS